MVEYALLIAGLSANSFSSMVGAIGTWFGSLNWGALSYVILALVVLRIAFWAFHSDA